MIWGIRQKQAGQKALQAGHHKFMPGLIIAVSARYWQATAKYRLITRFLLLACAGHINRF